MAAEDDSTACSVRLQRCYFRRLSRRCSLWRPRSYRNDKSYRSTVTPTTWQMIASQQRHVLKRYDHGTFFSESAYYPHQQLYTPTSPLAVMLLRTCIIESILYIWWPPASIPYCKLICAVNMYVYYTYAYSTGCMCGCTVSTKKCYLISLHNSVLTSMFPWRHDFLYNSMLFWPVHIWASSIQIIYSLDTGRKQSLLQWPYGCEDNKDTL